MAKDRPDVTPGPQPASCPLPDVLATADDREIVILFCVATVPYRLLLPHGRAAFRLDVAAPDEDPA